MLWWPSPWPQQHTDVIMLLIKKKKSILIKEDVWCGIEVWNTLQVKYLSQGNWLLWENENVVLYIHGYLEEMMEVNMLLSFEGMWAIKMSSK